MGEGLGSKKCKYSFVVWVLLPGEDFIVPILYYYVIIYNSSMLRITGYMWLRPEDEAK